MEPLEVVKQYHEQTKHEFNKYARSLGYMDWANQPDPFRRYEGAPLIKLPLLTAEDPPTSPSYDSLYSQETIPTQPLNIHSLSRFFEYSLSITAWKEYGGNRWALRSNPSSGNLHPTEGYLLIGDMAGLSLKPGLYHYAPKEHGLEYRMRETKECLGELLKPFPQETFLVGLSSIHWREAWKYGERAFRYCQHDIGHAIGTLRIAAATLGWRVFVLSGLDDRTVGALLGLNRLDEFEQAEPELPELMCAVFPTPIEQGQSMPLTLDDAAIEKWVQGDWQGKANRLSRDNPIPWEIINEVTKASWKHSTESPAIQVDPPPAIDRIAGATIQEQRAPHSALQIIHQRRSAQAFDGHTSITADQFFTMLERVFPHADLPVSQRPMPWDSIAWNPTIHLALFVHRVDGLAPGMYMFLRNSDSMLKDTFQQSMQEQFVWTIPENCPEPLPLYVLEEGNAQRIATQLSCGQDIAGASAFSMGMIAEFDASLDKHGPWFYKRLFWEAGLLGQVLYLEAEAAGVRSTGIGCFFDDPVHRVLGWYPKTQFQSLYHFTLGGPVDDQRLTTLPPYGEPLG
ncbi:MAG: SagB/ThcOx family dehydrogenase [Nitrospirae bacterium]|nr:SagB/ThcOx family dehydrogenase [Nitrospirota bacterium]MDA1303870.1 SagB/ThcOx family dehydrogenase [Nitrospirota bacterium]